jgi:hypothetical protein
MVEFEDDLIDAKAFALRGADAFYGAGFPGAEDDFHLHRLDHAERLPNEERFIKPSPFPETASARFTACRYLDAGSRGHQFRRQRQACK